MKTRYRPVSRQRRILILMLAIGTAITVVFMLLERPGGLHGPRAQPALAQPPAPEVCAAGAQTHCVGGKADVIALPPPAAASRAL